MHRIRTAHDHIADSRDHKHTDVPRHTVLQNNVPVVTVDTAEKYGFHAVQRMQIVQAFFHMQGHSDIVFRIQIVLVDEFFHPMTLIINHCRRLRRERVIIPAMCYKRPQYSHHTLARNGCHTGHQIAQLCRKQADHNIDQSVGRHGCQDLAVNQL